MLVSAQYYQQQYVQPAQYPYAPYNFQPYYQGMIPGFHSNLGGPISYPVQYPYSVPPVQPSGSQFVRLNPGPQPWLQPQGQTQQQQGQAQQPQEQVQQQQVQQSKDQVQPTEQQKEQPQVQQPQSVQQQSDPYAFVKANYIQVSPEVMNAYLQRYSLTGNIPVVLPTANEPNYIIKVSNTSSYSSTPQKYTKKSVYQTKPLTTTIVRQFKNDNYDPQKPINYKLNIVNGVEVTEPPTTEQITTSTEAPSTTAESEEPNNINSWLL